jgi:hypothetical protein
MNHFIQFDDESNKSAKVKEQCYTNKSMTSAIGEKLALMKTRLAAVRAGQSYEYCLREESQRKASLSGQCKSSTVQRIQHVLLT